MTMTESGTRMSSTFAPYNQYEVAIPLEVAGDCLMEVGAEIYGPRPLWDGFRTPALLRFITGEEFYLSYTHGGPRMFVNIEDYITLSSGERAGGGSRRCAGGPGWWQPPAGVRVAGGQNPSLPSGRPSRTPCMPLPIPLRALPGRPNTKVLDVLKLFRDRCSARLHWGKDGFPELAPCFDGAKEYPQTWCHYGCAVQELDPSSKFASESNVWRWSATRGGAAVPFASCCSAAGFSSQCACAPRTSCK